MGAPLEIRVDPEACQGAGECLLRAPATFQLGDDGQARVLSPPGDNEASILAAARSCPHFAIRVRRGDETLVR